MNIVSFQTHVLLACIPPLVTKTWTAYHVLEIFTRTIQGRMNVQLAMISRRQQEMALLQLQTALLLNVGAFLLRNYFVK